MTDRRGGGPARPLSGARASVAHARDIDILRALRDGVTGRCGTGPGPPGRPLTLGQPTGRGPLRRAGEGGLTWNAMRSAEEDFGLRVLLGWHGLELGGRVAQRHPDDVGGA